MNQKTKTKTKTNDFKSLLQQESKQESKERVVREKVGK